MKWVLLVLLVLTIASFVLGLWPSKSGSDAEDKQGAAYFYLLGFIFGGLLIFLVIATVIWQAFV